MVGSTLAGEFKEGRWDRGRIGDGTKEVRYLKYCACIQVRITIIGATEVGWAVVFKVKELTVDVSNADEKAGNKEAITVMLIHTTFNVEQFVYVQQSIPKQIQCLD